MTIFYNDKSFTEEYVVYVEDIFNRYTFSGIREACEFIGRYPGEAFGLFREVRECANYGKSNKSIVSGGWFHKDMSPARSMVNPLIESAYTYDL